MQCRIPSLSVRLESPEASEGQGVSLAVQVIKYAMRASCVQTHSSQSLTNPQWPLQPFCEPKVSNPTSWTDDGRPKSQYIAFNVKKRLVWAQDARDRQGVILLQHTTANNFEVLCAVLCVYVYLYDAYYTNVFDDMFILICLVYSPCHFCFFIHRICKSSLWLHRSEMYSSAFSCWRLGPCQCKKIVAFLQQ